MFEGLYEELGINKAYQVWYKTPKRKNVKSKGFDSLDEVRKWCKANKNRIKIHSGSWQVLNIMNEVKGKVNESKDNKEDLKWVVQ